VNKEQLSLYYGIGRYVSKNSRIGFLPLLYNSDLYPFAFCYMRQKYKNNAGEKKTKVFLCPVAKYHQ